MKSITNPAEFLGIKFSDGQRQSIRSYMESVLGNESYGYISDFFSFIRNSRARYKVILARKCFNLFNSYYRCNFEKPLPDIENTVISDTALFAYIPEIISEYQDTGLFPEILIADDILIHGRSISLFLDSFIGKIHQLLKNDGSQKDYYETEDEVLRSVSIITIVQSDRVLLMKPAYFQSLLNSGYQFHAWESCRWHYLSSKIAQINSEGSFSNTSYTLSLFEKNADENIHEYVEKTAVECGFIKSAWKKRNKRDCFVRPLRGANGGYSAFYTIRITQDDTLNKYIIVPFIILPDIRIECCRALFQKLFSNDLTQIFERNSFKDESCAQLLYLTLNYDLLLLLNQGDSRIPVSDDRLDIDKIMMNFGAHSAYGKAFAQLLEYKTPYLSWEELDEFIGGSSTELCAPVTEGASAPGTPEYNALEEAFEEIIACEGEQSEFNAYNDFTNQKMHVIAQPRKAIRTLFGQIDQKTASQGAPKSMTGLVADILRQMDMSAISVGAGMIPDSDSYHCVYRAGEQSQFIHPKKYANHIPVLVQMEKDCNSNQIEIQKRIANFYEYNEDLKNELCGYVSYLYSSGQRLRDWDINWNRYTEISDLTFEQYGQMDLPNNQLLFIQTLLDRASQYKEIDRYREMYPQN